MPPTVTEATMPRPVQAKPTQRYDIWRDLLRDLAPEVDRTIWIEAIKHDLESLLANENTNGYVFRPTGHAYHNARHWIKTAYGLMGNLYFRPSFTPDGEGGIDIQWTYKEKEVSFSCRAKAEYQDYIYWQSEDDYGAIEVSLETYQKARLNLKDRLEWLTL